MRNRALDALTTLYRDAIERFGADWHLVNNYVEKSLSKMSFGDKNRLLQEMEMVILDTNMRHRHNKVH